MENLGLIVLRANGDDIFFMLFFICVVVAFTSQATYAIR